MKWNKETDNELIRLINLNKNYEEIAIEFNVSYDSIRNRCFRLGLRRISTKNICCLQCGNEFIDLISNNRKFCSRSCSATFTNSRRGPMSDETKKKISEKNKSKSEPKIRNKRYCKNCDNEVINRKTICDNCRINYYDYYRPSCEFNFDIKNYEDNFDFKLIDKFGWYSPSNKGNNLGGVSKDHMYSVRDGFINKISPEIIKHPANCELMLHFNNSSKHSRSTITLEELLERIILWDNKYGVNI
jgi:hypothetical protein